MNIEIYLVVEPNGKPNMWSISHSEAQAWADYQSWFQTEDETVFKAAPEITELKAQGFKCVQITLTGTEI